jgi:hypothetical protein
MTIGIDIEIRLRTMCVTWSYVQANKTCTAATTPTALPRSQQLQMTAQLARDFQSVNVMSMITIPQSGGSAKTILFRENGFPLDLCQPNPMFNLTVIARISLMTSLQV